MYGGPPRSSPSRRVSESVLSGSGGSSGQKGKGKGGNSSVARRLRAIDSLLTVDQPYQLAGRPVLIARAEPVKSELTEMRDWHRGKERARKEAHDAAVAAAEANKAQRPPFPRQPIMALSGHPSLPF